MCGITLTYNFSGKPIDPQALVRMTDALAHRGPNDEGFVFFDPFGNARAVKNPRELSGDTTEYILGMGHRRLSILDLSPLGHQPMSTEDRSLWIIHNGEIYNYQSIRDELRGKGHRFRSDCDTEVILAAYREWGESCVRRFNGMWAFILYDVERKRLFISRDRFGIKPLYYAEQDGCLLFASEIKGLLAAGIPRDVNDGIVFDYLTRGYNDHTDETFFTHIHSFPARHTAVVGVDGKAAYKRYWHIDPESLARDPVDDVNNTTEEFRDILEDSIRLRLISDVPVGTCLSGGLDSSSIVAIISRILAAKAGGDARLSNALGPKQRTFSSCYHDDEADESRFSKIAADFAGAQRYIVHPTGDELWRDIEHFITCLLYTSPSPRDRTRSRMPSSA